MKLGRVLTSSRDKNFNDKYGDTYEGNFGVIEDFHKPLSEELGVPNPNWYDAVQAEHMTNCDFFTTPNYMLETCPLDEWEYVVGGKKPDSSLMGNNRVIKSIDTLEKLSLSIEARLTRIEVIVVNLYTGPMFYVYNTILRKYPTSQYSALKSSDSLFPTTIFVLMSAIQKLARVMVIAPGTVLYRGISGAMVIPTRFATPDSHGCVGMMEFGFLSTTTDLQVAVDYSGVKESRRYPKILKLVVGAVDRGADISLYSQYPGEQEYLWLPRCFLEPVGENDFLVEDFGVVEVLTMRINANLKAVTIEEYVGR